MNKIYFEEIEEYEYVDAIKFQDIPNRQAVYQPVDDDGCYLIAFDKNNVLFCDIDTGDIYPVWAEMWKDQDLVEIDKNVKISLVNSEED